MNSIWLSSSFFLVCQSDSSGIVYSFGYRLTLRFYARLLNGDVQPVKYTWTSINEYLWTREFYSFIEEYTSSVVLGMKKIINLTRLIVCRILIYGGSTVCEKHNQTVCDEVLKRNLFSLGIVDFLFDLLFTWQTSQFWLAKLVYTFTFFSFEYDEILIWAYFWYCVVFVC